VIGEWLQRIDCGSTCPQRRGVLGGLVCRFRWKGRTHTHLVGNLLALLRGGRVCAVVRALGEPSTEGASRDVVLRVARDMRGIMSGHSTHTNYTGAAPRMILALVGASGVRGGRILRQASFLLPYTSRCPSLRTFGNKRHGPVRWREVREGEGSG
jgi:hypothetical protein